MLDARASADVGSAPDSSFELAVAAAERARDAGARRRAAACGSSSPAATASPPSASERSADAPAAGARAAGRRAPSGRAARPPGRRAHRGRHDPARRARRRRAARGSSASSRSTRRASTRGLPRDAEALAALRAAGCARTGAAAARARARGRRPPTRARRDARPCAGAAVRARRRLRAAARARPAAARRSRRRGSRRSRCWRRRPRSLALRAGRRARPARARAGRARRSLARGRQLALGRARRSAASRASSRTRPRPGSRSCCRSPRDEQPGAARRGAARALRLAGRAGVVLARAPAPARRRAARAARRSCSSATVYDLPQYPWRALLAGALLLAFLFTGRPAGGGRRTRGWRPRRSRSPAAPRWPRCLRRPGRRCCRGRPGRSRTARPRPRHVDLVWDMRYRPLVVPDEAGGGAAGALAPRLPTGARSCSRTSTGCASRGHFRPSSTRASAGESCACRAGRRARRCAREVQVEAYADSFLVAPGQPVSYRLPARGRGGRPRRGRHRAAPARPAGGARLRRRGHRPEPLGAHAACAASRRIRPASSAGDLTFAGEVLPPFGTTDRERDLAVLFAVAPRRPGVGCVAGRLRAGRERSRAARPLRTRRSWRSRPGCARRAPTTSTPSLPERPDALARLGGRRHDRVLPDVRRVAGRARAARRACRRASPRDSPRAICAAASTT